jgi:hypothetical protein
MPRPAVKQDLPLTLGSAMSIFSPSKNNAVARLEHCEPELSTDIEDDRLAC